MNIQKEYNNGDASTENTRVYVIRHGESVGNLHRICLGHTDLDITDLGVKQAEKTAEALSDVDFAAIYASDLIRAVHTAEPHARMRGLEVRTSEERVDIEAERTSTITIAMMIVGRLSSIEGTIASKPSAATSASVLNILPKPPRK